MLYGESAEIYGTNKNSKKDGAILSSAADWKNTKVTKSVTMNTYNEEQVDTREKKYQQLQSSVFGGGYLEG